MKKAQYRAIGEYISKLEEIAAAIQEIVSSEEDAFSDKSERWQESEAGEAAQETIDTLNQIVEAIESAAGDLSGVCDED